MCIACLLAAALPAARRRVPLPANEGPLPWPDGQRAGGTLTWTGVAGLRFDLRGTSIAFDPFVTRPGPFAVLFRRPHIDRAAVAARFQALDAVFVGHTHYDHAMDLPAVADASPRAILYGSRTTVELGRRLGIEAARLVEVAPGDRVTTGPFVVRTVASEHGVVPLVGRIDRLDLPRRGLPWTPFRYPRGDVFAWRLETNGRSFHVQGSAGIDAEALAVEPEADVLLACLAARHGTPDYLRRLGDRLRPGILVPIHHDDFFRPLDDVLRPVTTLDWPAFRADADRMGAEHDTRLFCPPRDRTIGW